MLYENAAMIKGECEEIIDAIIKKKSSSDTIVRMPMDELMIIKSAIDLLDSALDLMVKEAGALDDINRKLDKLLSR